MAGFREIWCQGRLKEAVESLYFQSEACVRVQGGIQNGLRSRWERSKVQFLLFVDDLIVVENEQDIKKMLKYSMKR